MTILLMRDGSAIVKSDDLQQAISIGDAVLTAPNTFTAYQPEGEATATTLLIDTDYLIEHLFWQHLDLIPDRDAARALAAKLYPDPARARNGSSARSARYLRFIPVPRGPSQPPPS